MSDIHDNEPTAWEDINPPMASAQRRGQLSTYSEPDSRIVFRNELTACLALTAPVGMTEESRREWLAVAWDTLKHIPAELLEHGARIARQKCDHPSKIVPTIVAETADSMRWRNQRHERCDNEHLLPAPEYVTPEEAAEILREMGLKR